jgi:hypothetical protein
MSWFPGSHVSPLQQPEGQLAGSHAQAPPTHACPDGQAAPVEPHTHVPLALQVSAVIPHDWHAAPPVPHAVTVSVVSHAAPLQQPAHELDVHWHSSFTHSCPGAHAGPVPHAQVPVDEHWLDDDGAHGVQVAPLAPHCASVGCSHVVPSQQPAHDLASQVHTPPKQR